MPAYNAAKNLYYSLKRLSLHKISKDEQDKENQPPQIHGRVQGEGGLGVDAGEPDAAVTVQQEPTQPQPD